MLAMRIVIILAAAIGLVAFLTRLPAARRMFLLLLGLMAVYAVLKMTGVIEAIAPSRTGF